jgi:hypothetical protein
LPTHIHKMDRQNYLEEVTIPSKISCPGKSILEIYDTQTWQLTDLVRPFKGSSYHQRKYPNPSISLKSRISVGFGPRSARN